MEELNKYEMTISSRDIVKTAKNWQVVNAFVVILEIIDKNHNFISFNKSLILSFKVMRKVVGYSQFIFLRL